MNVRDYLEAVIAMDTREDRPIVHPARWLLDHGREMPIGRVKVKRGRPKQCYANATGQVLQSKGRLFYAEGMVLTLGIPIEHAWAVTLAGTVVECTTPPGHLTDYFGVTFTTEYLMETLLESRTYGLLDPTTPANRRLFNPAFDPEGVLRGN